MCCVVLGLGTVLKWTTGVNGVACLVMFFFSFLQRITFQQSFMHSSHSSHLLGKSAVCIVSKRTLVFMTLFPSRGERHQETFQQINSSSQNSRFP